MNKDYWIEGHCRVCGSPVVCGGIPGSYGGGEGDYIYYCSNKTCVNHKGEIFFDTEIPHDSWINFKHKAEQMRRQFA